MKPISAVAFLLALAGCAIMRTNGINEIAHCDTAGWAHDVAPDGNRVYVSDRQGGFDVFDRSMGWALIGKGAPVKEVISLAPNAGRPVLASRFDGLVLTSADGQAASRLQLGEIANAVVSRGDLVLAAYGRHGLVTARIDAEAQSLRLAAELPTPGWSHDVKLWGDRALLADWTYGLRVVDIGDPNHPAEIGVLASEATAISVAVRESPGPAIAAIAEGHAGVSLVKFDAAGRPARISRHPLGLNPADKPHPGAGGWAHGVALCDDFMFVADWKRGLAVFDIRNLEQPRLITELPTGGTALGVKAESASDGTITIFLADGEDGLRVFTMRK